MRVFGIDPGSTTGIAVIDFDGGDLTPVLVAAFPSPDGMVPIQRGIFQGFQVGKRIEELDPDCIWIEGYAYQKQHMLVPTVEIGTGIRGAILKAGKGFESVSPTALKKWVTGSGKATKNDMRKAVLERWGMALKIHDAADAFAVACYGSVHSSAQNP